ncbi:MAG: hypothetical protein A2Y74_06925 [Actinobacteria bacterium RBG_13_63_9]|nr:MAG: hypothetical protein A2Y74_06925 [Actinobacteria bacterium RBG_13_63_9]
MYIMRSPKFFNRIVLLVAFLVCIGAGFTLAVVLRERLGGGTAEEDPCFGQGEMVASWEHERTQADIDGLKSSRPDLVDMEPGMVEYRRCRWGPGYEVIIDEKGNVFSFSQPGPAELEAYYKEHPEENPHNIMATAEAESLQESFVTPDIPEEAVAGCDPSWVETTLQGVGVVFCHPANWTVVTDTTNSGGIRSGNGHVEVGIGSAASKGTAGTKCAAPELVETAAGTVRVCAFGPGIGQGHGFVLPSGREGGVNIYPEATDEERAIAFRVAFNAEVLP